VDGNLIAEALFLCGDAVGSEFAEGVDDRVIAGESILENS